MRRIRPRPIVAKAALGLWLLGIATSIAQEMPRDANGFTNYVAERFRQETGDGSVGIKGPLTIALGSFQVNLDRIYSFCNKNPPGCAAEVRNFVTGAVQLYRDREFTINKEAVRVVVRPTQYLQRVQASLPSGSPGVLAKPLVDGLVIVPVMDSPRAVRMLSDKDRIKLGLSVNEVHALAVTNLRKSLKPVMDVAKAVGPGQIGTLVGDYFHPSRLVLLDSWAPLVRAQGGVLIAAAPATDAVFYISEDSPVAIDALRALVRNAMNRAPGPLSDVLLRWTPNGWKRVS